MIRYADEKDFETVRKYDSHISEKELKNAIAFKRVLVMYHDDRFAGWLRFNLFWDEIPFMNMRSFSIGRTGIETAGLYCCRRNL